MAKERIVKQCLVCGHDFQVVPSYADKAKYCSYDPCFLSTRKTRRPPVTKTCECCQCVFTVPFIRETQRFCSRRCSTSGANNGMFGRPGSMRGRAAWNRGLTCVTDERLVSSGAKISQGLKARFASGASSHHGENNPNFGHTSETLTATQRDNYSRAAIQRVMDCVSGYKTGHVTGTHHTAKSVQPVKFKSSWELVAMMYWDLQKTIVSYEYEPEVVQLPNGRRTVPDFVVKYDDGRSVVIEIKPTAIQELSKVTEKLRLTEQVLAHRGLAYVVIGNHDITSMKREIGEKEFVAAIQRHQGGV